MLIGDLIYNDTFDCNCNFEIYDCTKDGAQYGNGAECIYSTAKDGYIKPLNRILDMRVKYITTKVSHGKDGVSARGVLIIEAEKF